jgi:hypothetical protein
MQPYEILLGKCDQTPVGQVRRVIEISGDTVIYEEVSRTAGSERTSVMRTTESLERFASRVISEVPCTRDGWAGWT